MSLMNIQKLLDSIFHLKLSLGYINDVLKRGISRLSVVYISLEMAPKNKLGLRYFFLEFRLFFFWSLGYNKNLFVLRPLINPVSTSVLSSL
jgi:hypothetical protein